MTKEEISKHYELRYGDDLIRISEICGQLIGQGDLIGLRWVFEALKIIEMRALKLAGIDIGDSSKKISIN